MEIGKTLYVSNRNEWRSWLEENFEKENEVWLVYPKKSSGKESILYNDAVEEALCFGWIDSIRKRLDENHSVQRFSPRRSGSSYSQQNKERLKWLVEHDFIHPSIRTAIEPVLQEEFVFPPDILAKIKENEIAWEFYQQFSPAYQRIRVAYIDSARKRPEEFSRRLKKFIRATEQNKQIGYGGIDKYF